MKTLLLIFALAGSQAADGYLTQRSLSLGSRELNPLARPFVHGRAWAGVALGGEFALEVGGALWLQKRGHAKLAHTELGIAALGHAAGAGWTEYMYTQREEWRPSYPPMPPPRPEPKPR